MRLLLDEMLSAVIAEQLRARGQDVVAVSERADLRGMPDRELFALVQEDRRAVVTYNRDDFLELDRQYRQAGQEHAGVVIVHPRHFPQRQPASIGRLVTALEALLASGPPYPSFVHWLQ